jgi:phospholipid N-methyltransferase
MVLMAETGSSPLSIAEGLAGGGLAGGAIVASGVNPNPIQSVTSSLDFVTKIYNAVSSRSFIQRMAEGVVGGALILIAVAHMTGASNTVTKALKVAAK